MPSDFLCPTATMGKGRPASAPPVLVKPFVWPALYRQPPIIVEVKGGEDMNDAQYEAARREIPWQFRPPMRHPLPFIDEVEPMRAHVAAMLESHKRKMEEQAREEAAAAAAKKAAGKKGKGRPQSAKK